MNPRDPQYLRRLSEYARARSDRVEGIFLSPIHKGAADHVTKVIGDIVSRYDVDGIHLDYIRFPNDEFDYSAEALDEFRADVTSRTSGAERREYASRARGRPLFYTEMFPQGWQEFRRARLTALLTRIRSTVKARRPRAMLTAAVFPDANDATNRRFQDWGGWLETGLLDAICPMAYTTDPALFRTQIANVEQLAGSAPCGPASARISSLLPPRSRTSARRGSSAPKASCCFPTTTSTADTSRRLRKRPSRRERFRPRRRRGAARRRGARVSCRGRRSRHARRGAVAAGVRQRSTTIPILLLPENSTIFDLASLTKVIATTSLVMRLVERGALALNRSDPEVDSRMARKGSRRRDAAIAADAQLGAHRMASLLSRSHGTAGISARDLFAAARVSARHAGDLQRSRLHPARVHRRRCGRRSRSEIKPRSC